MPPGTARRPVRNTHTLHLLPQPSLPWCSAEAQRSWGQLNMRTPRGQEPASKNRACAPTSCSRRPFPRGQAGVRIGDSPIGDERVCRSRPPPPVSLARRGCKFRLERSRITPASLSQKKKGRREMNAPHIKKTARTFHERGVQTPGHCQPHLGKVHKTLGGGDSSRRPGSDSRTLDKELAQGRTNRHHFTLQKTASATLAITRARREAAIFAQRGAGGRSSW